MDRQRRISLARRSVEGLSTGDAFGERFFASRETILQLINSRDLPKAPCRYTDDTEMALSIYEVLANRAGTWSRTDHRHR
jgi:ADP-ribosylglycohydrolase